MNEEIKKLEDKINDLETQQDALEQQLWALNHPPKYKVFDKIRVGNKKYIVIDVTCQSTFSMSYARPSWNWEYTYATKNGPRTISQLSV